MYQVCDIDGLIKVSPYAVFYMFHAVIGLLATGTKSAPYLSAKALLCVTVYVSGLVALEKKQTQSRIARTIGRVTHDALNRLAGELPMLCAQMVAGMLSLITGIYDSGYIILDDTVVPKPFSRLVAGTYVDYDPTQKRHVRCHRIVVVIWTNGVIYIPVAFAFWHHRAFVRKYRTKNQIARTLIYYVVRHRIPFSYLTFDNWYASKQNLRFFDKRGIKFVTRLRNNTWIIHENERQKIQKITKYECHYYGTLNAYVRHFQVTYPSFGIGSLAIVKNDKHEEPGKTKYLFTADDSISVGDMQKHLRSLHCLYQPNEVPKLVSMQQDGTLLPITLEDVINPVRTRIPSMMGLKIPDIIESTNAA